MPLTHIVLGPDEEPLSIEEARARVAQRGDQERYTPELLESMLAARGPERDYISTTSLTAKCLRGLALQRQVPYTDSLDRLWAAFRGTMFHGQLEKFVGPEALEEPRFHVDLDIDGKKLHLSGSPDLVDPVSGKLYDYKFTKEAPRFGPWKEHVAQCQINRWLCDHADYMEWRGATWRPAPYLDGGRYFVKYGGNDKDAVLVRPRDWQGLHVVYMDDRGVKNYLCQTSIDVPKASGVGTKKARVADVWSDDVAREHIETRYVEAHDALTLGNVPPVPVGFEHQSHPLCAFCPVRTECAKRDRSGE